MLPFRNLRKAEALAQQGSGGGGFDELQLLPAHLQRHLLLYPHQS